MAEVKVEESVEAPASAVWELASDFGGVDKWAGPAILGCSVEGEGIGAVRTLSLPGGATLQEKLESFDEAARTLSYSIVDPSPLPLRGYLSTLHVAEDGPQRCRVEWSGRMEPAGASEEQVTGMIRGIYTGGIAGIRKALGL
jgi:hypothetical protein